MHSLNKFAFASISFLFFTNAFAAPSPTKAESHPTGVILVQPTDTTIPQGCVGSDFTWNMAGECQKFVITKWYNKKHENFQLNPVDESTCWVEDIGKTPIGMPPHQKIVCGEPEGDKKPIKWQTSSQDTLHDGDAIDFFAYVLEGYMEARGIPDGHCEKSLMLTRSVEDGMPYTMVRLAWHELDGSEEEMQEEATPTKAAASACSSLTLITPTDEPTVPVPTPTGDAFPRDGTIGRLRVLHEGKDAGCIDDRGDWINPDNHESCGGFKTHYLGNSTDTFHLSTHWGTCEFVEMYWCSLQGVRGWVHADGDMMVNPWLQYNMTHYSKDFSGNPPANASHSGWWYIGDDDKGSATIQIQWVNNSISGVN